MAQVGGATVTVVEYVGGSFEYLGGGQWEQYAAGGLTGQYSEIARDDWAVYLEDSLGGRVQCDLQRGWVSTAAPGGDYQDVYRITSSDDRVNGRMVREANHATGSFRMEGGGWRQYDSTNGQTFLFEEVGRDTWSVSLYDPIRGFFKRIEMDRLWITYWDAMNPNPVDVYRITSHVPSSGPSAPPLPPVSLTCDPSSGPVSVGQTWASVCSVTGGIPPYDFTATALPAGITVTQSSATTATISGAPTQPGPFSFTVFGRDSSNPKKQDGETFAGTIPPGGDPLRLSCTPSTGPVAVGRFYSTTCSASGGLPPYQLGIDAGIPGALPAGLSSQISPASVTISGTPTTGGNYRFGVTAFDSQAQPQQTSQEFTGVIQETVDTVDLHCSPSAGPTRAGEAYSSICTASGAASFVFSTAGTLPAGLSLTTTGLKTATVAGTPQQAGPYSFAVVAADAAAPGNQASAGFSGVIVGSLKLTCAPSTGPVAVGQLYTTTCTASGGVEPYQFGVNTANPGPLPQGLSAQIGVRSVTISGAPTTGGAYRFDVTVADSHGPPQQASHTFSGTMPTPSTPLGLSCNPSSGPSYVGEEYSMTCVASGAADFSFRIAGALPAGLSLTKTGPTTATVRGKTQEEGIYSFQVVAADSTAPEKQASVNFSGEVGGPLKLTCSPATGPQGAGLFYTTTCIASGGTPPYAFGINLGIGDQLPEGLSAQFTSNTATVSGSPAFGGGSLFNVGVIDSVGGFAQHSFRGASAGATSSLLINCTPNIGPTAVGQSYRSTCTAMGASSFEFATSGGLPAGLQLTQIDGLTARISGTPQQPGPYSYQVIARDSLDQARQTAAPFEGTVARLGEPLQITCDPGAGPTIAGEPYQAYCWATGGTPPYVFGLNPPGVFLDGLNGALALDNMVVIFGAAREVGPYSFGVAVQDAANAMRTHTFMGTVQARPVELPPFVPLSGFKDVPFDLRLAAPTGCVPPFQQAWGVVSGHLPPGLGIELTPDRTTAKIVGGPTEPGTFPFTLEAVDAEGRTCQVPYSVSIAESGWAAVLSPYFGDGGFDPDFKIAAKNEGEPLYTNIGTALRGVTNPRWEPIPQLPPGLVFDPCTGELYGRPTGSFDGTITVRARVDGQSEPIEREYDLNILARVSPVSTASFGAPAAAQSDGCTGLGLNIRSDSRYQTGSIGRPFEVELRVNDFRQANASGGLTPLRWSISGELPPGIEFNNGKFDGVPAVSGRFPVTVTVMDSDGNSHRAQFELIIRADLTAVSAASFKTPVAPESLVTGFSIGMTQQEETANRLPLPTQLASIQVEIEDEEGKLYLAGLHFASDKQVNLLWPKESSLGVGRVRVYRDGVLVAEGAVRVEETAPALFAYYREDQETLAVGHVFRRRQGETMASVDRLVAGGEPFPIEMEPGDVTVLELWVTGARTGREMATASVGGVALPSIYYLEPDDHFAGVEQLNLILPPELAGRGLAAIELTVGERTSTLVYVHLQ